MQESSKYKEYMEMIGKEQVMRLFLEKHRDGIVIDKKEMQSYYEEHKQDYTSVHAYTLVRKNEKELDAYLEVLKSSSKAEREKTFIMLAKKHSQHPKKEQGGDLGFVGYTTIVKPFGKEAFALKDNSYTLKPFKTVLGWHIVYAKEKKVISFEKVKKSIENTLRTKAYREWFKVL
jgi:parvulin-like peptidyl-prolyl isomerase